MKKRLTAGFDFGTESLRVVLVDIASGEVVAQASSDYRNGVLDDRLPGIHGSAAGRLPPEYALQDPRDWVDSAAAACGEAMREGNIQADQVIGIGVAFTSCTMLPARADGTPLCLNDGFGSVPLAWPRLWKHHAAMAETDRMTEVARARNEPWLARYGGLIGLEGFFPKVLEALVHEPRVYAAADVWIEAGDWFVWQLVDGPFPKCSPANITRSTCQAGYKAFWNRHDGYPSRAFFAAVNPAMADVVSAKMPGQVRSPGTRAGTLNETMAGRLGLRAGIPVSTAIIDAHAGVPGSGVAEADAMVLVLGTSACHMLNSSVEKFVPGVAGVVQDGILGGLFGYETGQASVGDALSWFVETFQLTHESLIERAAQLSPGSNGVVALDWLNGCRTPLMDGHLSGAFVGMTLGTRAEQMYRALIEATGFGLRWIVDTLREGGVKVEKFVASGGLPAKNPLLMQIYSDILAKPIYLAETTQSVALGAAILGCLAVKAGMTGYSSDAEAIRAMARQRTDLVYQPEAEAVGKYQRLYEMYRVLADKGGPVVGVMHQLRKLGAGEGAKDA
jgi:L-ribulokinase